ncbi:hypothetical protein ACFLU6_06060 [Acidobacteriota bacterium]
MNAQLLHCLSIRHTKQSQLPGVGCQFNERLIALALPVLMLYDTDGFLPPDAARRGKEREVGHAPKCLSDCHAFSRSPSCCVRPETGFDHQEQRIWGGEENGGEIFRGGQLGDPTGEK